MAEMVTPGPVREEKGFREAVCVHTKKIMDSCQSKDCLENLRVFVNDADQRIIDQAVSVKSGAAELLHAYIDVEEMRYKKGFYAVNVRFYYRITADVSTCAGRLTPVSGLAVFQKRCVLYGGSSGAKVFSSTTHSGDPIREDGALPEAVVEVVDPMVLCLRLVDSRCCQAMNDSCVEIPQPVAECFPEALNMCNGSQNIYVTLGQFSILRLERDTQLLMPAYDYCIPCKACTCEDEGCQKDPCELFQAVNFPMDAFFPGGGKDSCIPEPGGCGCGCGCSK